jgi:hypothetical protein
MDFHKNSGVQAGAAEFRLNSELVWNRTPAGLVFRTRAFEEKSNKNEQKTKKRLPLSESLLG